MSAYSAPAAPATQTELPEIWVTCPAAREVAPERSQAAASWLVAVARAASEVPETVAVTSIVPAAEPSVSVVCAWPFASVVAL